jgi:hypothetical protein
MPTFYLKFDYPDWGNTYYKVTAPTERDAIRKLLKGTKDIPENRVHVWKGRGIPKSVAGRGV